eukprot:233629_1
MITSTTHNHDHKDSKDSKEMIVPLHQRTPQQLCSCIKQWVLGDVNYLNSISETQRKFKQRVYHAIAQCFVFSIKNEDDLLRELQHWICNNCGNCNVNSSINSSFTTDVTVCTLCGLRQIDQ